MIVFQDSDSAVEPPSQIQSEVKKYAHRQTLQTMHLSNPLSYIQHDAHRIRVEIDSLDSGASFSITHECHNSAPSPRLDSRLRPSL